MKKFTSALALAAVMGLPVAAQADVNISGYVAAGIAQYDYSGNATADASDEQLKIDDGRYSRFRFAGNEDLGNGLTADFMIEQRVELDDASLSGVGNGNMWVGLAGGFGKVMLGRIDTYYSDGVLTELSRATGFASFGTLSLLTQVGGAYAVRPSRHDNQIRYVTPSLGGFKGTIAYSSGTSGDGDEFGGRGGDGDTVYLSGYYFQGPIYAGLSYIQQDAEGGPTAMFTPTTDTETVSVDLDGDGTAETVTVSVAGDPALGTGDVTGIRGYGSYTFPFGLKVGLNVDQTEIEYTGGGSMERMAWFLPVTYKTGPHAVYFAYGEADDLELNTGDVANSGAKFWNIGYDYALSNRTSIGANWTQVNNDDAGTYALFLGSAADALGGHGGASAGLEARQLYLGVAHAF